MARYFVFLRAINVGGRTIKMDALRDLFMSFGYANVETFIASGNVILEAEESSASKLEANIEAQLQAALGYSVPTIIRSDRELMDIEKYQPFSPQMLAEKSDVYYVWLLKGAPAAEVAGIVQNYQTPNDQFHLHGREVYWLCSTRISESEAPTTKIERAFGTPCTMRNVNTVRRLVKKYLAG